MNTDHTIRQLTGCKALDHVLDKYPNSLPCNGAADGLSKAIVIMNNLKNDLANLPNDLNNFDIYLHVVENHTTISVQIELRGHIERCVSVL